MKKKVEKPEPEETNMDQLTMSKIQKLMQTKKRPSSSNIKSKQEVSEALTGRRSCKPKTIKMEHVDNPVIQRAEDIQSKLGANNCSFIKPMLRSHVSGGFWLGLPKQFCVKHLPTDDDTVFLVDECGDKYRTKYLAAKTGLSGGWRGFSIAHNLLEQDVLVFELIRPCQFKVYIVRANSFSEAEGAFTLLNFEYSANRTNFEKKSNTHNEGENGLTLLSNASFEPIPENSEYASDVCSETFDGIKFSESSIEYKEVKGIENFKILINGLIIDSVVTDNFRKKYYELCCSQKSFLHDNLIKGMNCKLAAGIICETVNIAEAIGACKPNMSLDDILEWAKCLKAFELMGMNVDFILNRLNQVLELGFDCREASELKRRGEDRLGRVQEEVRLLEEKVKEIREVMKGNGAEVVFNEVVKLPISENL